jgi:CHAD domain-containing protein
VEREVKYAVDPGFTTPDLSGIAHTVEALPELVLRARYVDTPDLDLWTRRITARHRDGEGPEGGLWTVKLPAPGEGPTLDRSELSWPGTGGHPPVAVTTLLAGVVRGAGLGVVAELTTRRRRLVFRDASGTALGELDDDRVSVVADGAERGSFRQIELEVGPTGDSLLGPVGTRLVGAGARFSNEPKLARALAELAVVTPEGPPVPGRRSRMGEVVRTRIADGMDVILTHDVRLRLDSEDPPAHSIHQARVATRRLRSDLQLLGGLLEPRWVEETRSELQWLGGLLGAVRDADVLGLEFGAIARLPPEELPVDPLGFDELRVRLGAERRDHGRALAAAMTGSRYLGLLDRLAAAALEPPLPATVRRSGGRRSGAERAARKDLPHLVAKRLRALDRAVATGGRRPTDSQLHRIRIRSKQLRYAAETAEPVLGRKARRVAEAAASAQGVLGDLHDTVAAEAWLAGTAAAVSGRAAFTAGLLVADQVHRRRRLRRQWGTARDRIERPKVRGWLDHA